MAHGVVAGRGKEERGKNRNKKCVFFIFFVLSFSLSIRLTYEYYHTAVDIQEPWFYKGFCNPPSRT
jgi:hypothetical protein